MQAERKAMDQKEKEYQERQQEILKEEEAKREAEIIALSRDHYLTPAVRGRAHAAYAGWPGIRWCHLKGFRPF